MNRDGHHDSGNLRRGLKDRDSWWTVLAVDPLAMAVLPFLNRQRHITPMRLTAVAAVLGGASCILFASGQLRLAALVFEVRFFLDCLDGKLARIRGHASPRGAFFDMASDVVLITANFAALSYYAVLTSGLAIAVALALTGCVAVLPWLYTYRGVFARAGEQASGDLVDAGSRSRLDDWLTRHRLARRPGTVEVETLVLFLAPLVAVPILVEAALWLGLVYYLVACTYVAVTCFLELPVASRIGGV